MSLPTVDAPCFLCGAPDADPLWTTSDRAFAVPGIYTVARCRSCGFLYQRPRVRDEHLAACYPDHYPRHQEPSPRVPFKGSPARVRAVRWALALAARLRVARGRSAMGCSTRAARRAPVPAYQVGLPAVAWAGPLPRRGLRLGRRAGRRAGARLAGGGGRGGRGRGEEGAALQPARARGGSARGAVRSGRVRLRDGLSRARARAGSGRGGPPHARLARSRRACSSSRCPMRAASARASSGGRGRGSSCRGISRTSRPRRWARPSRRPGGASSGPGTRRSRATTSGAWGSGCATDGSVGWRGLCRVAARVRRAEALAGADAAAGAVAWAGGSGAGGDRAPAPSLRPPLTLPSPLRGEGNEEGRLLIAEGTVDGVAERAVGGVAAEVVVEDGADLPRACWGPRCAA